MIKKILNPNTGRLVNVNGKIGQNLLSQYNSQKGGNITWARSLQMARKNLGITHFEPIKKGSKLYNETKKIYTNSNSILYGGTHGEYGCDNRMLHNIKLLEEVKTVANNQISSAINFLKSGQKKLKDYHSIDTAREKYNNIGLYINKLNEIRRKIADEEDISIIKGYYNIIRNHINDFKRSGLDHPPGEDLPYITEEIEIDDLLNIFSYKSSPQLTEKQAAELDSFKLDLSSMDYYEDKL